jgi:hypothetical protein
LLLYQSGLSDLLEFLQDLWLLSPPSMMQNRLFLLVLWHRSNL